MVEIPEKLFRLAQHNKMMGNGKRLVLPDDLCSECISFQVVIF